jgi:hypothetical protein
MLVAGHEHRSMTCRFVQGPPATTPLEALKMFWTSAIRAEIERTTAFGPENNIRQPAP